jgi:hypothetical protein
MHYGKRNLTAVLKPSARQNTPPTMLFDLEDKRPRSQSRFHADVVRTSITAMGSRNHL